jgi:hypothetical protein
MYRCVLYLQDGRTVAAAARETWDEADADLAARMATGRYTGGHIEAHVEGAGWVLCNGRPDKPKLGPGRTIWAEDEE